MKVDGVRFGRTGMLETASGGTDGKITRLGDTLRLCWAGTGIQGHGRVSGDGSRLKEFTPGLTCSAQVPRGFAPGSRCCLL